MKGFKAVSPARPADLLSEAFRQFSGFTQQHFADALGMSRLTANELLKGRRAITPLMALKLARLFGTDAEFWVRLQMEWDLHQLRMSHQAELEAMVPLREFVPDGRVARRVTRDELIKLSLEGVEGA